MSKIKDPHGNDMKGYKVKKLKVLTAADAAKAEVTKKMAKARAEAPAKKKSHNDSKKKERK
jgi:hypothetical protein